MSAPKSYYKDSTLFLAVKLHALAHTCGLGFVLSFGYWCTNFVLMQRALAARNVTSARKVPLLAGFGKLGFSIIVVLPGLAAHKLFPSLGLSQRFDQALSLMMIYFYGPTMLVLGLTALAASLMSGLAANVSGFAVVWTDDIYRAHLRPCESERHYKQMGTAATIAAVVVSVLTSSMSLYFCDLAEHIQLVISTLAAPFWAIFLLGVVRERRPTREP